MNWKQEDGYSECVLDDKNGKPLLKLRAVKRGDGKFDAVIRDGKTGIEVSRCRQPSDTEEEARKECVRGAEKYAYHGLTFTTLMICVIDDIVAEQARERILQRRRNHFASGGVSNN